MYNSLQKTVLLIVGLFIFTITITILQTSISKAAPTANTIRVATTGSDISGCGTSATPCRTINHAINQAESGDTILVAAGTYTTPGSCVIGSAIMCVFAKAITIFGGYTTSNWSVPDPTTNLTIIDGQNSNRPILLDGRTHPGTPKIHVEGFTVQNGFVQGGTSGSDLQKAAFGGGLLAETAEFTIRNMVFKNNVAQGGDSSDPVGGFGSGGGIAIKRAANRTLLENITFEGNKAYGGNGGQRGGYGIGGGLFTFDSIIDGNNLSFDNNISVGGDTSGSGVYNGENSDAQGAGIAIQISSDVVFKNITSTNNRSTGGNAANGEAGGAFGAGIFAEQAKVFISDLVVENNVATGGNGKNDTLSASLAFGGGVAFSHSNTIIEQASIINNTAQGGNGNVYAGSAGGGGVYIERFSGSFNTSLTNVIVADNDINMGSGNPQAGGGGGGMFINSSPATLTHVTFARNELGSANMLGNGITLISGAQATISHSIIADHTTPGGANAVHAQPGNSVTFNNNLLSGNSSDTGGGGSFNGTGSNFTGSPDFVSSGSPNYDYHIKSGSDAIDQAVGSSTSVDIDNQSRTDFTPADVGADEFAPIVLTAVSNDAELQLNWEADTNLLAGFHHYQILVTPSGGANAPNEGTSINANTQTSYTLTGLTNYENYTIVVEGQTNANAKIGQSNTITIFPTDIHLYLPTIIK